MDRFDYEERIRELEAQLKLMEERFLNIIPRKTG